MIREALLCLLLAAAPHAMAAEPAQSAPGPAAAPTKENAVAALPPMDFVSTVARDELYTALKADPALARLDKELAGSPLTLMVTHTLRPTSGGQAAGLLSAVLAGSTLGLIPIVSSEQLVVRYEVLLNGKTIATYSFEPTATRAMNLWSAGKDGYGGLGKAGMEWVKSTAPEGATKLAHDPALQAVHDEIDYYFPEAATANP